MVEAFEEKQIGLGFSSEQRFVTIGLLHYEFFIQVEEQRKIRVPYNFKNESLCKYI